MRTPRIKRGKALEYNEIQIQTQGTNMFDLSHDVKMTSKMGELTPAMCLEVLPGDNISLGCESFLRFAPLISPVLHQMNVRVEYYFVPNRIIWEAWEDFIANKTTGGIPTVTIDGGLTDAEERFLDYFGIPPFTGSGGTPVEINALPLMAYQKIYMDYYRDQNLVNEEDTKLVDGNQAIGIMATMRKRAWEHDYFTSCLPTAQADGAVDIPLGEVELTPGYTPVDYNKPRFVTMVGETDGGDQFIKQDDVGEGRQIYGTIDTVSSELKYNPAGSLTVGASTVNNLRLAIRIQEWLEKFMRAGRRYVEVIKASFNVDAGDPRLDRPEYITGMKAPVVISEVLNTTGSFASDAEPTSPPQGAMAGHGVSVGFGNNSSYQVMEHGYIIGIMSVLPRTGYAQGIERTFLRTDPQDFFWPDFAHLGEQAVTKNEIAAYEANGNTTFGYLPVYSDYRYKLSRVAGDFRPGKPLDFWTLVRNLDPFTVALNQEFIECSPEDVETIFAVQDGTDNLYVQLVHKVYARRKIPLFGTPNL